MLRAGAGLVLVALSCACAAHAPPPPSEAAPAEPATAPATTPGATPAAAATPTPCAGPPHALGRVQSAELNEISGVVESRRDPRVLFVHNDSGDSPRIFAIDRSGALLSELKLGGVPMVLDCEELAIGPAPGGEHYLYVGDTGNNFASFHVGIPRRKAVIYRMLEPKPEGVGPQAKQTVTDVFPIVLTFPDGARDVEAFFIDPRGGDLFVITKQPDGHSQLLTASAAVLAGGGDRLQLLGELQFGSARLPGSTMPTAADISSDGSSILVRTYSSVFLFRRGPSESVVQALLAGTPEQLPALPEGQGESIAFVDRDSAYLTISEGVSPSINCGGIDQR